jgi:hypothetical protein
MHFTRRLLDRRVSAIFLVTSFVGAGAAAVSCSSSDPSASAPPTDAGTLDAALDDADAGAASPGDAGVDAAPLPVVCTSRPCARALVTTLGSDADDRSEGFCALLDDGTVACWGANGAGQLGRGDAAGTLDSAVAARVVGLTNVTALDHTCALDTAGAVWCWGTGPFLRADAGSTVTTERAPVKLELPSATAVGLGYSTACAVVGGGVVCWGSNADAQVEPLTNGVEDKVVPKAIPLPSGPPVRVLAVGRATFALREDGTLVTWGGNPPIGRVSPLFPDPYAEAIALGGIATTDLVYDNACATARGTGYCWGARIRPNQGSVIDRALPEPVLTPEPIVQIATTRTHALEGGDFQRYRWCASAVSGVVYCWGLNDSGQAGDGKQNYAFDAVKVEGLPAPVAQVKTTSSTTCALATNGKVFCWGGNYNGQLGNGQIRGRSLVPTEVVLP